MIKPKTRKLKSNINFKNVTKMENSIEGSSIGDSSALGQDSSRPKFRKQNFDMYGSQEGVPSDGKIIDIGVKSNSSFSNKDLVSMMN